MVLPDLSTGHRYFWSITANTLPIGARLTNPCSGEAVRLALRRKRGR